MTKSFPGSEHASEYSQMFGPSLLRFTVFSHKITLHKMCPYSELSIINEHCNGHL